MSGLETVLGATISKVPSLVAKRKYALPAIVMRLAAGTFKLAPTASSSALPTAK